MRMWIDADACPRPVKDMVCRAAERTGVEAIFVANTDLRLPPSPVCRAVRVGKGFDVADDYIQQAAEAGDLVVTQDVPLAAACVGKGATCVDPRGEPFDTENTASRLAFRNLMEEQRNAGLLTGGGPAPFGEKDRRRFAGALDRWLTHARSRRPR